MEQSISDQESTILVAGSALENLELLSQMLELDGYVVLRVTQVEKIIEAALLHGPDLILLDMIRPDRDGMNICQHIKACDSLNNIPVIFIQPRADWKRIAEGFKIGGSDYISTPIIPEEARARIGYYLKLHATIKLHDALLKQVDEHNKKIEATIKEKNKQLQQNEKLAAIGAMVGEFTHEISTPVGIALTALSHNYDALKTIKKQYDDDALDKEAFSYFLDNSIETSNIASNNLERMVALVKSFKRTTVNQCHDVRRLFQLKECLADVIASLQPRIKHSALTLTLECKEDFLVNSYPGTFAQIVINFVNNSLMHAFKKGETGEMILQVRCEGDRLVISFTDNGRGIPEALQAKIFDKFYTTKLGQDGSGLGLHIVRTLVQDKLHGTVVCHSQAGEGCEFEIELSLAALK